MSTEFIDIANTENIQRKLWIQCENEEFCDVVLIAGNKEKRISAHSNILSAASEYFKEIFQSLKYENQLKEVKLPSVDGDILKILVKYCYTGRVIINKDIAVELLKTAHELLLENVVHACGNFLVEQLHPSNCLEFAHLAEQYHSDTLLQKARDYSLKHFMAVRETDEFLRLNSEQLIELLASDNLTVSSEEHIFNSLLTWIRHDAIEREKYLAELLKLVRLPLLKKSFLREHVKPICMDTSRECLAIYIEAVEELASFDDEKPNCRNWTKPRKSSNEFLMGIAPYGTKLQIQYHCQEQLKWMKCSTSLEYNDYSGITVMEDNLFLVGGAQSDDTVLNTVDCINLKTMNLKEVSPMTVNRKWCGVAVLNGLLYAVGGANKDGNSLNSVEKWNPKTNTWSTVASMSVSRDSFGIAVLNGKLYAVGGFTSNGVTNSAECYNPHQNVWMSIASMHEARHNFGVAVRNGLLYAVGGDACIESVERYNPETNSWSMVTNINEYLINSQMCTTFRDKVIVCYNNRVEEYNEETNEWKPSTSLKALGNNHSIFTYSGELFTSKFVES